MQTVFNDTEADVEAAQRAYEARRRDLCREIHSRADRMEIILTEFLLWNHALWPIERMTVSSLTRLLERIEEVQGKSA